MSLSSQRAIGPPRAVAGSWSRSASDSRRRRPNAAVEKSSSCEGRKSLEQVSLSVHSQHQEGVLDEQSLANGIFGVARG